MRDEQAGALVAAVGDGRGSSDGSLGAGLAPGPAVVAVARQWLADGDDQLGVGIDDDLVVGGVAVVLGCSAMLWSRVGTRVPSTMSTASLRNRCRCLRASWGPRWSMIRSTADLETPNSGASWRSVKFVRQ